MDAETGKEGGRDGGKGRPTFESLMVTLSANREKVLDLDRTERILIEEDKLLLMRKQSADETYTNLLKRTQRAKEVVEIQAKSLNLLASLEKQRSELVKGFESIKAKVTFYGNEARKYKEMKEKEEQDLDANINLEYERTRGEERREKEREIRTLEGQVVEAKRRVDLLKRQSQDMEWRKEEEMQRLEKEFQQIVAEKQRELNEAVKREKAAKAAAIEQYQELMNKMKAQFEAQSQTLRNKLDKLQKKNVSGKAGGDSGAASGLKPKKGILKAPKEKAANEGGPLGWSISNIITSDNGMEKGEEGGDAEGGGGEETEGAGRAQEEDRGEKVAGGGGGDATGEGEATGRGGEWTSRGKGKGKRKKLMPKTQFEEYFKAVGDYSEFL